MRVATYELHLRAHVHHAATHHGTARDDEATDHAVGVTVEMRPLIDWNPPSCVS